MKRVRMLLRVSSDQQLEADGDLSVQRQILIDYIKKQDEWILDKKEYFEGSKSAYKNTASEREVLQEILYDAENKEFDILVPYKDDRVGRLMWDTPLYIMTLKSHGVDVYSVKDGCISPEADDIMGQMMLTFRYANAQKSSADTGMRVKDTAEKLVQQGKFMGGYAPYGYRLEFSGEISKHGRALKHLVIVSEQAEVVKHIYDLSINKEFGSTRIAKELNLDERYKNLAPKDVWKSGTITSILTNPIYAGHTAYKRREKVNGKYHRLDSNDWTISFEANKDIAIIDGDTWNKAQDKRKMRKNQYTKKLENQNITVIKRNDGMLALVDVAYCGYCGSKLVNGSKYDYWTLKGTGERKIRKTPVYKCQNACRGVPHNKTCRFRAEQIEPVIFEVLAEYIGKLQENESVFDEIVKNQNKEIIKKEKELKEGRLEISRILDKVKIMESHIPEAMTGDYPLSLEELIALIKNQKANLEQKKEKIKKNESALRNTSAIISEWNNLRKKIPTWQEVFLSADTATKRVLMSRLTERIDVKKDEIAVYFKINLNDFLV